MNKYLNNFYNLFSSDDQIVYKAVIEKKDWMFRHLYLVCSFKEEIKDNQKTYPEIYALNDQSVIFDSINSLNDELFVDHENQKEKIIEAYNQKFTHKYFYEDIPLLKKGEFLLEIDFTKLDKDTYNALVANFYPCVDNVKDLDLFYDDTSIIDLLKYPMYGKDRTWVLILDVSKTFNHRFYLPAIKSIVYNKKLLTEEMIETLKEIKEKNNFEMKELNNGL